jgi:hypothetical protein
MNHQAIVAAAALAFFATAHAGPVAPKAGHEKCFAIAKDEAKAKTQQGKKG